MANPWETPAPWEQAPPAAATDAPVPAAPPTEPWKSPAPWESPPEPDPGQINTMLKNNPNVRAAQDPIEAFKAGFQVSASGIQFGRPNLSEPNNATFSEKLASSIGQGIGDLPYNVIGAFAGGAAGAETGPGAVATAGAGAFALPQTIREAYMDYYDRGEVHTFKDFMQMFGKSVWNVGQQAGMGAILGPLAKFAEGGTAALGGGKFAQTAASIGTYTAGVTGVNSAVNGKAPDAEDLAVNAVSALGFHVALSGAGRLTQTFKVGDTTIQGDEKAYNTVKDNMANIYRQTGTPPWEQAAAAKADPKLRDELMSQDVNGQPTPTQFNAQRPEEFEPFTTNPMKLQDEHDQMMHDLHGEALKGAQANAMVANHVNQMLPMVKTLEGSADNAISPAGAVGRFQIMPGTARQYGYDPSKLMDPAYNERVARTVLADLSRRFHGDTEAVLAAYNAGPGRAITFLNHGRDRGVLPPETQHYLQHADELGAEQGAAGGGGRPPVPPKPPENPPPEPEKKPDGTFNYTKLSDEMLTDRFKDSVGEQPIQGTKLWGMEMELDAAKGIDQELVRRGLLDPDAPGMNTEDMFRQTYGSQNRFSHFVERGPVDPITFEATEGPSWKDVDTEVNKVGNWDEMDAYRVALRTIEKSKQGIDTGVFKNGVGEAEEIASRPGFKKYAAANDMLQQWKSSVLAYVRDSGGISQKQVDRMEELNTSHVSLRRVMGDDAAFGGNGRGFKARNPIKAMEGSDRQIVSPRRADLDNARMMIAFADRNRAAGHLVGMAERTDLGLQKLPAPEAKAMIADPGSNVFKPYSMSDQQAEAIAPLVARGQVGAGNRANQFLYYRDGVPEVWQANDENIARLVRGADTPAEASIIEKVGTLPAKLERAGIVGAPLWGTGIVLRHQLTAFILSPIHPPPFISLLRHSLDAFGKGDDFWELARQGGLTGAATDIDKNYVDPNNQALLRDTGAAAKLWNTVQHPLQFSQMITERLTAASRIGAYKAAQAQGMEPGKAAMGARKAYLDYDERFVGNIAQNTAKWVPFFKADWLGLRQGWDAVQPGQIGKTAIYATLGLVLPQIALYVLNRRADKDLPIAQQYTSLPPYQRDLYFTTPPIGGVRLRLEKPFNVGPLLGIPLERFLEKQYEQDPHYFDGMLQQMLQAGGGNVLEPIPSVAKPVIEQQANYSFFSRFPLVSDSLKDATRDLQYTPNTTELAKKLASLTGGHDETGVGINSPPVFENYVRNYTGGVGMAILQALSAPFKEDTTPFDPSQLPFVRGFTVREPGMNAAQINNYYTDAEKFLALHKDVGLEIKAGNIADAQRDAAYGNVTMINGLNHALSVIRTALNKVNDNKTLNVDEKRQLTERLYADGIHLAQFGSKTLRTGSADFDEGNTVSQDTAADVTKAVGQ